MGISLNFRNIFGKTQERSQLCLINTDDGRSIIKEIPVLASAAVNNDTCSGYLVDRDNQFRDELTGRLYQLVDEKSAVPICIIKPANIEGLTALINGIFHHSWTTELASIDREYGKDRQKALLYIILMIAVCITALILAKQAFMP